MEDYVKIGHARHDENHGSRGGQAGDQTTKEVDITSYYVHSKGWYVLRCKSKEKANLIAEAAIQACKNQNIGYDQSQRSTLFYEAKKFKYDISKVKKKVETDCSALVRVCIAYAYKKDLTGDMTTEKLKDVLLKTKEFTLLSTDKYCKKSEYLKKGDILVTREKGHTAVVLNDGSQSFSFETPSLFNPSFAGEYITAQSANLRTGAGTDHFKILTMPKDLHVFSNGSYTKVDKDKLWLKIFFEYKRNSYQGYVSKKLLK